MFFFTVRVFYCQSFLLWRFVSKSSSILTRGQALFSKQLCHQVAVGSTPAAHLAFWLVSTVGHYVPHLALSAHASNPPAPLVLAGDIFVEIFSHRMLSPNGLAQATAVGIYAVFIDMPPK
jgi:hypothetical protein